MRESYGLCYKGSKNLLVEWLFNNFPLADNFYDLFAGGCAVTDYALSHGYKNVFSNDITDYPILFKEYVTGARVFPKEFITRDKFLASTDISIKAVYSFGFNCKTYLYGKYIEKWAQACFANKEDNNKTLLKEWFDVTTAESDNALREKYTKGTIRLLGYTDEELKLYDSLKKIGVFDSIVQGTAGYKKVHKRIEELTYEQCKRLCDLDSIYKYKDLINCYNHILRGIKRIKTSKKRYKECNNNLFVSQGSYDSVTIKDNSIIYCDIPYKSTDKYSISFDYASFYDWCSKQEQLTIISEYKMPTDRFICIASKERNNTLAGRVATYSKVTEKLFIPIHQKALYELCRNKAY